MAPDGKRFVYRSFGPDGEGLRIMNLETKAVTTLTEGYDNFPLWSPRGDLIMFSRAAAGRLRDLHHQAGRHRRQAADVLTRQRRAHGLVARRRIDRLGAARASDSRTRAIYTDAPQPYGELFVMRYDGTRRPAADRQSVGGRHAGLAAGAAAAVGPNRRAADSLV